MAKGAKKEALAEIGGIKVTKLNARAIDAAIKRLALQVPETGAPELVRKVGALQSYFETRPEPEMSGPCDNCGAASSLELDSCPFCGIGEEAVDPEDVKDGSVEEAAGDESTSLAVVEPAFHDAVLETGTAADLDKAVQEIIALERGHAASAWLLATKVAEVAKTQIWKQRLDQEGKVKYRTFEQFALEELQMSRKYAQDLQKLHARFTEEDFRLHGPTKLRLVIAAPEEQQQEVLARLKEGASGRDIKRDVLGRRDKDLNVEKTDNRKKGSKASKAAEKGDRITVAAILGRKTIPLYAKPTDPKKTAENKPAKKLEDYPWGYMDMANDVRIYFAVLQKPSGELVARVEVKRVEE